MFGEKGQDMLEIYNKPCISKIQCVFVGLCLSYFRITVIITLAKQFKGGRFYYFYLQLQREAVHSGWDNIAVCVFVCVCGHVCNISLVFNLFNIKMFIS